MRRLTDLAALALLLLTARRWLFTLVALAPRHEEAPEQALSPTVLLVVVARDEERELPELLARLDRLDYPRDRLRCLLVDDGSSDGTRDALETWAVARPTARTISLEPSRGKAAALNAALGADPFGEVVAVYDADERPRPTALRALAGCFADPRVVGASGRRVVRERPGGAVAHATFEALVHQLVTARAKDRLGLAPPLLGSNCAYRRGALEAVGGFRPGALLEDTDVTLRLAAGGGRLRFAADARSEGDAPETMRGYFRQRARWARGFNDVAGERAVPVLRERSLPFALRLELLAFSLGYSERLLLALVLAAAAGGRASRSARRVGLAAAVTAAAQVAAALAVDRAPLRLWAQTLWIPVFVLVDVAAAGTALANALLRRAQPWERRRERDLSGPVSATSA